MYTIDPWTMQGLGMPNFHKIENAHKINSWPSVYSSFICNSFISMVLHRSLYHCSGIHSQILLANVLVKSLCWSWKDDFCNSSKSFMQCSVSDARRALWNKSRRVAHDILILLTNHCWFNLLLQRSPENLFKI